MVKHVIVGILVVFGAAMGWGGAGSLGAAAPSSAPGSTALQEEAGRLREATGMEWRVRVSSREGAAGVWAVLSAGTSAWHGVFVPYIVLPYGPDDEGKAKLASFRENNNNSLDIVAADDNRVLLAGPSREPGLTAKVLGALGMKESPESAKSRLGDAQADWLDFRLGVAKADADAKLPVPLAKGPTPEQINDYAGLLAEKGPNGGRHRGDPFLWYSPVAFCDLPGSLVTTPDRQKVTYVLLSDRPDDVMLNGSRRPRPWHLKGVLAANDPQGRPAVALEFDDTAAKRMGALTESNVGRPLAVLFDDNVLAVMKIESKITDKLVISGGKLDKALVERIVVSLKECMLAEDEAGRGGGP